MPRPRVDRPRLQRGRPRGPEQLGRPPGGLVTFLCDRPPSIGGVGTPLGSKVVHRLARTLGAQVLPTRLRVLEEGRAGRLAAGTELAGNRVAAMRDGGRPRLRPVPRKHKGKGPKKKQRRRYPAEWREPKLLIIVAIDEHGRMKVGTRPWIDGTFAGPDAAMELLAFPRHHLGAAAAKEEVVVADAALWIWDRLNWVERRGAVGRSGGPCLGLLPGGASSQSGVGGVVVGPVTWWRNWSGWESWRVGRRPCRSRWRTCAST